MDDIAYLAQSLGLEAQAAKWDGAAALPVFLRASCKVSLVTTPYGDFLLARLSGEASLPELKRAHAQLGRRTHLPVAVSAPGADARQRAALVRQGVPFVCAGREVFLPFLGLAGRERASAGRAPEDTRKLTPKALQAACWAMANPGPFTLADLRGATGMGAGQASSAAAELARSGLATRAKEGRTVVVTPLSRDEALGGHMGVLSSPVRASTLVRRTAEVEALPDAGETALASRTALNAPAIPQKAAWGPAAGALRGVEVLEGELPNDEAAVVQVWRYNPLFEGEAEIDDVSLALSLAGTEDERVALAVDDLFGRGYPWREAL